MRPVFQRLVGFGSAVLCATAAAGMSYWFTYKGYDYVDVYDEYYTESLEFIPPVRLVLDDLQGRDDDALATLKFASPLCGDLIQCWGTSEAVVRQIADDVLTRRHLKKMAEATRKNAEAATTSSKMNTASIAIATASLVLSILGFLRRK